MVQGKKTTTPQPPKEFDLTWEPLQRYPWETELSWWGLIEYAMLGPGRTLDALAAALKARSVPVPSTDRSRLGKWSARYHWVTRVELFDQQLRQRDLEMYVDEDAKASLQRRRIASSMLTVAEALNERLKAVMLRRVEPREVAGYTTAALQASRVEHSGHTEDPSQKVKVEVGVDGDLATLLRESIASRLTRAPSKVGGDEPAAD